MQQRSRSRQHAGPRWWLWLAAVSSLGAPAARSQAVPDAGALLRETQRDSPQPPPRPLPPTPTAPAEPARPGGEMRFSISRFQLEGATLLPEAALQAALAPWLNRPIAFSDLERAGDALVEAYRRAGFYLRVQLPPQDIEAGVVRVQLIEARLGAVTLDSASTASRESPEFVIGMVMARQQTGAPLDAAALDRAAALLSDAPGVLATIALRPGRSTGETDVSISLRDAPRRTGLVQADDQGARSTGGFRLGGVLSLDGPAGVADQAVLGTSVSDGSRYARLAYSRPLGHDGLRLGIEASLMHYRLLQEFGVLDARGDAQTVALTAQYPIVRGPQRNLLLGASLGRRLYQDEALGARTDDKRLSSLTVDLAGDAADDLGGGGSTLWGLGFSAGRVGLSGHAESAAADAAGPRTQGGFGKWTLRLARAQRLGDETTLWLSFNGQLASRNLDSSEKFSLGGPYGVRACPALEGSGDSGFIATLELRRALTPHWQASAFVDAGAVRRDQHAGYAGAALPQDVRLKGGGFSLAWGRSGDFNLRATVARRVGSNPLALPDGANSDGSRGRTRVWAIGTKYF